MTTRATSTLAIAAVGALALTTIVATSASAAVEELVVIPTANSSAYVEFSPDGGTAYVVNQGADSVSVIDVATSTKITDIQVAPEPHGIDVTADGSQVWVTNMDGQAVSMINAVTNTFVDTIPLGRGLSYDIDITPDGTKAYVANYNDTTGGWTGSVSVIDVATATVITTVNTPGFPQSVEVTPDGTKAFVALTSGAVGIIDVATNTLDKSVPIPQGPYPTSIVFSPDGATAYLTSNTQDEVSFYDVATEAIVASIPVGDGPLYLDITPDGSTIYVVFAGGVLEGVQAIDVATQTAAPVIPAGTHPNGVAVSPGGDSVYIASGSEVHVFVEPVRRLTGTNRYETAIKVSQAGFPGGADVVFVATGTDYPDALAAGPAAAEMGGPVILTDNTTLFPAVKAEIERLDPEQIYVVGGPDRVSNAILAQLDAIAQTDRVTGTNRYETSRLIADLAFDTVPQVYIATGLNFPDALAAGAAGAVYGAPVILVNGTAPAVDQATLDLLVEFGNPITTVVGGTNMVSDGIKNQLSATRITGTNRYETALEINKAAYAGDSANRAILATGVIFPDALSASAWAGRIDAPLYLAPTSCVPQGVLDHMFELGVVQVTLVGGPDRLTQSVFDLTPC